MISTLLEPGERRVVEVAGQRLERLVDAGAAQVERRGHGPGALSRRPDAGAAGARRGRPGPDPRPRLPGARSRGSRAAARPVAGTDAGSRSSTATVTRIPPASSVARRAAPLERRDPALPAAASGSVPARRAARRAARPAAADRLGRLGRREAAERLLGAGDRGVEGRRGHRLALERLRRSPATSSRGSSTSRSASARAARTASSRSRRARRRSSSAVAQRLGRARLGGPGPLERLARLALGLADRGERRLERALRLGQARAGVGDDRLRQPEPLGDRERLAAAGQPDRQPVGRRQRLEVELDRRVARRRASCGRTP